jgi:hypothetical protein
MSKTKLIMEELAMKRKIIILTLLFTMFLEMFSAENNFYEQYKNLINNPSLLTNEQFKKGIDREEDIIVITDRYIDNIFDNIKIEESKENILKYIKKMQYKLISKEYLDKEEKIFLVSSKYGLYNVSFYFSNEKLKNIIIASSKIPLSTILEHFENYKTKEDYLSRGINSPNLKYRVSYFGISDNEKYFVFRNNDYSEKDYFCGISKSLKYSWLNDFLFIFTNNLYEPPTIIDVKKKESIDIEEILKLPLDTLSNSRLEDIAKQYFTLREEKYYYVIKYSYTNRINLSLEKYTKIIDIKNWNHPIKDVLTGLGMEILYIELIDKNTYPIITVKNLPNNLSSSNLEKILKVNGYWNLRIREKYGSSFKIFGDKGNKKLLKVEYE